MRTYVTTKELKTKELTINGQDINQIIGIQLTIMLEIKLQKYVFYQNMTSFLAAVVSFLNPCEDGNVQTYATTKELKKGIYGKNSECKRSN